MRIDSYPIYYNTRVRIAKVVKNLLVVEGRVQVPVIYFCPIYPIEIRVLHHFIDGQAVDGIPSHQAAY